MREAIGLGAAGFAFSSHAPDCEVEDAAGAEVATLPGPLVGATAVVGVAPVVVVESLSDVVADDGFDPGVSMMSATTP
ncbi:MAG: hypothetical protein ACREJT_05955, partial [Myxococcota bacterium]